MSMGGREKSSMQKTNGCTSMVNAHSSQVPVCKFNPDGRQAVSFGQFLQVDGLYPLTAGETRP